MCRAHEAPKARSPQTPYTCGVCSCCGRFVAPGPRTDVSGKAGVTHLVLPRGQAAQRLEAGTGSASGGDGRHWCSRSVTARSSDSPYGQPESAARMASWSARVSRTIVRPCRRAVSSASAVPSSPSAPRLRTRSRTSRSGTGRPASSTPSSVHAGTTDPARPAVNRWREASWPPRVVECGPAGPRLLLGETRVDERKHVVRIRIPADHRLRKHERVVHVNVKDAVAAGDDLDRREITLVLLKQSRRQTDGVREGASRNAVLDADAECVRHCLDSCIRKRLCAAVERLATPATPELSARRAPSVLSAPARLLFRRRRLGRPVWDALGDARRQDVHLTRPSCIR